MNIKGALDIINLLAKAWAEKTDGDVSDVFKSIAKLAAEAQEPSNCPLCFGDMYVLYSDGAMHPCPACNGSGKRQ